MTGIFLQRASSLLTFTVLRCKMESDANSAIWSNILYRSVDIRILQIVLSGRCVLSQVVASFAASFYLSWELTVVLIGAVPFIGLAGWFMIGLQHIK